MSGTISKKKNKYNNFNKALFIEKIYKSILDKYIFYLKNNKIRMLKYKNYNIETHRHVYSRIQTTDDRQFINVFMINKR